MNAGWRGHRQHLETSKERVNNTLLGKCPFWLQSSSYTCFSFCAINARATSEFVCSCTDQSDASIIDPRIKALEGIER